MTGEFFNQGKALAGHGGGTMRVVIVGNNVAGTNAAKATRDADANAEIEMFTDEETAYYPRPKLIDFVAGAVKENELLFYPMDWYAKNRIKLHLGSRVERLEPTSKEIVLDGRRVAFDKLVLANGSSAFVPPLKGLPKEGVFTLRTLADAKRIREAAAKARSAILIGGGLLGLETARALASGFPGLKMTILEYAEHLLMRQLDHEGAAIIQEWIEKLGTKVVTKAEAEEILGGPGVTGVRLKDGTVFEGDIVIISAGARPNLALAKDAGLKVSRGVVVDGSLRTSSPDVFAIGDVAEFEGKVWGIIPPALDQARVLGKKIVDQDAPDYKGTVPSNTLKVMGFDLTTIGTVRSEHEPPEPGYEEIRAVAPDRSVYKKFVFKGDELIGAIVLGSKKDANKVVKVIKEGESIASLKPKLADPSFSLP